jgi:hypothetical protein
MEEVVERLRFLRRGLEWALLGELIPAEGFPRREQSKIVLRRTPKLYLASERQH